jgi:glycosyltransferase involved in cell wall biosynthesis
MNEKQFTVLLAIHRSPELLPYAVKSVLAQTVEDFNLCIICDGAPRETSDVARNLAETDKRITVHDCPKGRRIGEEHRHAVLEKANSRYVAHIADDDLWMNNHLSELSTLLQEVDFGNLLHVFLSPEGDIQTYPFDLADKKVQQRMLMQNWNFFGPTVAGYRLSAYRQLEKKWGPAPENLFSDLFMWRKFLRSEKIIVGTRFAVTSFVLPTPSQGKKPLAERAADAAHWWKILQSTEGQAHIRHDVLQFLVRKNMASEARRRDLEFNYFHFKKSRLSWVTNGLRYLKKNA